MRLLRSWPTKVPTGRSFVVDPMPKLILDNYDYGPLADVDDDVVLLEWDIAIDREGLAQFVRTAKEYPERVIVAPYQLYVSTVHSHPLRRPRWCHRRADGQHIDTGERTCAMFGFGMIYLPQQVVSRYFAERNPAWGFNDAGFSSWHHRNVAEQVPVLWDVRPVHLHYQWDDLGPASPVDPALLGWVGAVSQWPDPDADDAAAVAWTGDPIVAALLRERAGLARRRDGGRVAAVNEQLALRGYKEE